MAKDIQSFLSQRDRSLLSLLSYSLGQYVVPSRFTAEEWRYWLCIIRKLPERIRYRSLSLRDHREAW